MIKYHLEGTVPNNNLYR